MSIARFGWAGLLVLSAAGCRATPLPTTPAPVPNTPLAAATLTFAEAQPPMPAEAEDPPPPPQQVQIVVQGDAYADTDPSALVDFRATLDPYGTWLNDSVYGTVWVPSRTYVGTGFTPYLTAGHWVYDNDYVWVSDYPWGWAPFHYGRWVFIPAIGWSWIPGRAYAGAWVDWRLSDDSAYLGWAPTPPSWIWREGVPVGIGFAPWEPWAFAPRAHVFSREIHTRALVGAPAAELERRTRPYVRPGPAYAGNPLARPYMRGPAPAMLAVPPAQVRRPSPADRGLVRARQFARPSTARPMGARPATPHAVRPSPAPVRQPAPATRPPGRR